MTELKISVLEERATDCAVIHLSGIINAATSGELEKVLKSLADGKCQLIMLNLSSVEYISTTGWSLLISAAEKIHKDNREIFLTNMITNVSEIYTLLEFDKIIRSFDSTKEALQSLHKQDNQEAL
jgi:anti-sigma B factor antagonist